MAKTNSTKVQPTTKKGDKDYSLVTIKMIVKANNSTAEYLKKNGKDYHFWTTEDWTNFRDHAASQRVRLLLDRFGECFENEILTEYFEWKKTHISMRETEYQDRIKELEKQLSLYESKKSQQKADAKTARKAAIAAKEETKESEEGSSANSRKEYDRMENDYYNLVQWSGQRIIELRQHIETDDRVPSPKYYDITEIDPDQYYMASIIYEDVTELTAVYIEEIIYPINAEKGV